MHSGEIYFKAINDTGILKVLKIDKNTTIELSNEKVNIFKKAKIEGYEEVNDKDYDKMREILKYINFPPYQKF